LAPGAQLTIDIFANTGPATSGTVQTTLQVSSIGSVDNIAATTPSTALQGQLMSYNIGTLQAPALIVSTSTPSQYIASGSTGATNSSQATYNFVSTSGPSTITELKFAATTGTVTNVCVTPQGGGAAICNSPVNGVADLTGLNLSVLNNGGLAQNVQVSYAPVGNNGIAPATTSQIGLSYVKYTSGGTTSTMCASGCTSVLSVQNAPAVALVGSVPTVTISQTTPATGLILGGQDQIGQVTVAASTQGAIRVHQISFNVGNSGFATGTPGNLQLLNPTLDNGSTPIVGASCSTNGTSTVTCTLGTGYGSDFIITAGQSQTFNLYAQVNGSNASGSTASVSSSVSAAGFIWDDSSTNGQTITVNGVSGNGVGLSGAGTSPESIYSFPTNSYSIHD